jgi:DNA-binding transcriptional MocR family regulator
MPAAVRKLTSTRALQDSSLRYGDPMGDAELRRAGAAPGRAQHARAAAQIITTVGATHALDIVSRTLLKAATR